MANEKSARVYEAAEHLEGAKPKVTMMNHKCCTPGEFGMRVKEALGKNAGSVSETISRANPLNYMGGGALGGLAALLTPTRSLAQQAEYDAGDNMLRAVGNVVVPGMGPYNSWKRTGAAIRSPEMNQIRKMREADKLKRELAFQDFDDDKEDKKEEKKPTRKAAGWASELVGAMNPINGLAAIPAGIAAAVTPTRTLDEQAAADEEMLSNIFIPGRNYYNMWKRTGAASRSPEMLKMIAAARRKKLETLQSEIGNKSARDFGAAVKLAFLGEYTAPALGGATLGAGIGGIAGLINPGEEDQYDDNGRVIGRKQRSRLSAALSGALMGGVGGGAVGAGAQYAGYGNHIGQLGSYLGQGAKQLGAYLNKQTGDMPAKAMNRAYAAAGGIPDARYVPTDVYMRAKHRQNPFADVDAQDAARAVKNKSLEQKRVQELATRKPFKAQPGQLPTGADLAETPTQVANEKLEEQVNSPE
jgi:hypothetical protein